MTTVTFDIDVDTAEGLAAAEGTIHFTPWPGARVEASKLVMPAGFSQKIPSTPTFTVDLPPTTSAWAWQVRIVIRKGGGKAVETFFVQVPSSGTHAFTSLAQVDPKSLVPGAEPGPAWNLALAELASRVDEFEGANPEVIGQAVGDYLDANPVSGLPAGGTTGQVLAKASGDDGDGEWVNPPSGKWGELEDQPAYAGVGSSPGAARAAIGAASSSDLTALENTVDTLIDDAIAADRIVTPIQLESALEAFEPSSAPAVVLRSGDGSWPERPAGAATVFWLDLTGLSPSDPSDFEPGFDVIFDPGVA